MMGTNNFSDNFKRDAVVRITERGYPVSEVSNRLGVSAHSLFAWKKRLSKPTDPGANGQSSEIHRLKQELARVTEERNLLKEATAYFVEDAK